MKQTLSNRLTSADISATLLYKFMVIQLDKGKVNKVLIFVTRLTPVPLWIKDTLQDLPALFGTISLPEPITVKKQIQV